LQAWRTFESLPWPKPTDEAWRRTRLTGFMLEQFQPVVTPPPGAVDDQIRHELAEMESAASLVFQNGDVIHRETNTDLAAQGIIFTDLRRAVNEHSDLVRRYFMTEVVKPDHNKFAALHAALWDTGAFIYVPKNVKVELPLQVILSQS